MLQGFLFFHRGNGHKEVLNDALLNKTKIKELGSLLSNSYKKKIPFQICHFYFTRSFQHFVVFIIRRNSPIDSCFEFFPLTWYFTLSAPFNGDLRDN